MAGKVQFLVRCALFLFVAFIFANSLFPTAISNLMHPCTPSPRAVVMSSLEFNLGWTACIGLSSTIRGMVIDRDKLILGDYRSNVVTAFNLESGEIRWQTSIQESSNLTFDTIRERLYTSAFDGKIYAVNANTGAVVWLNDDYEGKHDGYAPLLLANGEIIGRNAFSAPPRPINVDTGAFGETISAASTRVFPDGHAWIVQNGTLTAINALSGESVWQAAEANIADDRCLNDVQVNRTTVLAKLCNQLVAYDYETRAIRWAQHIDRIVGFASLTDENVYVLDASATLQILTLSDGSQSGMIQFEAPASGHEWATHGGDQIGGSQIVASGNWIAVYFGDTNLLSVYQIR